MEIAEIIMELRGRTGLSQARLARAARLHASTVSRWERGETAPSLNELNAVLRALDATEQERIAALRAMDAPRSRQALQKVAPAFAPDAIAEMWRILRLRAGLSLTELSLAVGVNSSTISRWERGRMTPSPSLVHQLFHTLNAYPLERAALIRGRLSLRRPEAARFTPEEYQHDIATLFPQAFSRRSSLIELTALSRMEELTARAASDTRFLPVLADVYNLMGARMKALGNDRECIAWCDRGLSFLDPSPENKSVWAALQFRKGYCLSKRRQYALLESLLPEFNQKRDADRRSQIYREMASAALVMGHRRWAIHLAQSACEAADESAHEDYIQGSGLIWGRVLAATGRAEEAIPYLSPVFSLAREEEDPLAAAQLRLEWARTLLACREVDAAHDHLNHFYRIIEQYRMPHLLAQGEAIARKLALAR